MKRFVFAVLASVMTLAALRAGIVEDFYLEPERVAAHVDSVVAATPADSLPGLLQRVDDLFFEPLSPTYCEGIAALYLRAALPRLTDEIEIDIARWKLNEVCLLNAEGTPASDFTFDLFGGPRNVTMSRYLKGQPLCLIFYDPDCSHCAEVIRELGELSRLVNVLAVCVESTPERWEETCGSLPRGWGRAFDSGNLVETESYMIRSYPSIYLLDADRNVVLKNPSASRLLNHLSQ